MPAALVHPVAASRSARDRLGLGQGHPQRRDDAGWGERQLAAERVRRQQHVVAADPGAVGAEHESGPGALERGRGRSLVDADAGVEQALAQARRELARVEHAAEPLEDAAGHRLGQAEGRSVDELDLGPGAGEVGGDLLRPAHAAGGQRHGDVAGPLEVAVDPVALDQLFGEAHRAVGDPDELGRPAPVDGREQLRVAGDRRRQMAGVAGARAPAAELRLDEHRLEAVLAQAHRGRHAAEAAADHDGVGVELALGRLSPPRRRPRPAAERQKLRFCRSIRGRRLSSSREHICGGSAAPVMLRRWSAADELDPEGRRRRPRGRGRGSRRLDRDPAGRPPRDRGGSGRARSVRRVRRRAQRRPRRRRHRAVGPHLRPRRCADDRLRPRLDLCGRVLEAAGAGAQGRAAARRLRSPRARAERAPAGPQLLDRDLRQGPRQRARGLRARRTSGRCWSVTRSAR